MPVWSRPRSAARRGADRPGGRRDTGALLRWCLRDAGGRLAVAWLFGVGYQAGLLALPEILGRALDDGIDAGRLGVLYAWAAAVLAIAVLLTAGEMGMRWYATLGATRTANRLVARLVGHLLRLDRATVGRFGHGDLVTRGTRDVEAVSTWLRSTPSLLSGLLGAAGVVVAVALLDPAVAVVGLATLPLLVLVNLWFPPRFERAGRRVSDAHAARADAVEDLLSASAAVRGLGGEGVLVRRHHRRSAEVTEQTLALSRIAANWSAYAPFLPALATGIGLLTGGLAVLDGRLSVGDLVAFTGWMNLLSLQVIVLTQRFNVIGLAWTALGRIAAVLHTTPAVRDPDAPVALPDRGDLVGMGLRADPPDRPPLVFPDLRVRPGEFVAVTGPVGSGKTTLLRLLARLEDPAAGVVSFGGVPLTDAALDEVRGRITIVDQRPVLLSGTIADNLRLGLPPDETADGAGPRADEAALPRAAELRGACRVAAIEGHVDALPDGYASEVGERGGALSGGQVQRVALARALLRRAPVLLLDDVTSAVDAGTEEAILTRLPRWAPGTTIIAATSRPEVVRRADRVIRLGADGGRDGDAGGGGSGLGAAEPATAEDAPAPTATPDGSGPDTAALTGGGHG